MFDTSMFVLGAFAFAIWLISAMLLRFSCVMTAAPKPGFVAASLLMLIVLGATVAMHFVVSLGMGMTAHGLSLNLDTAGRLSLMLGLPIHMLVAATSYKMMLPTTFGKAMSVWVVQALTFALLYVGFGMVMSALAPQGWAQMHAMMPV